MPRKSRNVKATPSNTRAMRTILRNVDANLGKLVNKQDRLDWLKPIAVGENFPYTGSKEIGPHHNEETLHEAITYAVRDAKKNRYKELKGPPAMNQFFKVGSAMLNSEYLVAIGYMFLDDSGALQLRDEADARNDDPISSVREADSAASFRSANQLATGLTANDSSQVNVPVEGLSSVESTQKKHDSDRTWTPGDREKEVVTVLDNKHDSLATSTQQLERKDLSPATTARQIVYEPVPTSAGATKRKFVESPDSSDASPFPENTMDDVGLWQELCRMKLIVEEVSTSLCAPSHLSKLHRSPSTLLNQLYAHIFNTSAWRLSFDNLLKRTPVQRSSLLQAIFWSFINLRIFPTPLFAMSPAQTGVAFDYGTAMSSALAPLTELFPHHPTAVTRLFQESAFRVNVLQPFAETLAGDLQALVTEHLSAADDNIPPASHSNPVPHMWAFSIEATLRDLCEKALLLRGRMDASNCGYRLLHHHSGSDIYFPQGLTSSRNISSKGEGRERVAFTVAPGLERKVRTGGAAEGGEAGTYVVVGPAVVAEARK
ncbi:hypothetical protein CERZMDRAFT_87204 [Cercospora zeae-maydis SCOH1-5]|uniref:Uncharacterized protein n=1 Tax=Cercospora zeae-maydis SCOH1-5 TaxID=717836 RepID=A0A6A6F6D1_9PEZI|nr:hypothetical protein CERZMDRAFT_87204 [Cercospora zeae-maydis SCOH1-5]